MRYVLLVCDQENTVLSESEQQARVAAYTAFQDEMKARGVLLSRERLRPTSSSTTVRVRDAGLVVADGPFAETKEQIAGFYVIECADIDAAVEVAARVPGARSGTVEVRPVWEM
jgi:hypothetical protein